MGEVRVVLWDVWGREFQLVDVVDVAEGLCSGRQEKEGVRWQEILEQSSFLRAMGMGGIVAISLYVWSYVCWMCGHSRGP